MKVLLSLALLVVLISSVSLKQSHDWTEHQDNEYTTLTDHWVLEFQHASRNGVGQDSNSFAVEFNGERIKEWHPTDYNIHSKKFDLTSRVGKNSIHFIGTGISDGLGHGIDNVKLHRMSFCGYENVIINGGLKKDTNLVMDGHTLPTVKFLDGVLLTVIWKSDGEDSITQDGLMIITSLSLIPITTLMFLKHSNWTNGKESKVSSDH